MLRTLRVPLTLRSCGLLVTAALLAATAVGQQLPSPQLSNVFPPGGKAGTSVDVKVAGIDLDELTALTFSHPGLSASPKMGETNAIITTAKPLPNEFTVKINGDVPPGYYEVRAIGRYGMSTARIFAVNSGDEIVKSASIDTRENAMELPLGATASGRVDASKIDYYKLNLKPGQRVLVECAAERLDSRMDATLVLFSPQGKELTRVRDSIGRDPLLDFTATAEGAYLIGVYDFTYGGGPDHIYRLTVAATPHIDFIFPPSGLPGSNGQFTVYGRNLPGGKPVAGMTIENAPLEQLAVNVPLPGDDASRVKLPVAGMMPTHLAAVDGFDYRVTGPSGASNAARIDFALAPVIVETEPNSVPEQAVKVSLPCEFVGQFYPSNDVDWVSFDAKKGEEYSIEVYSHRLGAVTDPAIIVQKVTTDAEGKVTVANVGEADDSSDRQQRIGAAFDVTSDDPAFRFKADADATYRVSVRDNFGSGAPDPRKVYRLVIRPPQPDFRLVAFADLSRDPQDGNKMYIASPVVNQGGTLVVTAALLRTGGFDGEVEISVEGLPGGVTCPNAILGGGVEQAALVISAAETAAAWSGPIRIVGKAKIAGKDVVREARAASLVWPPSQQQQQPVVTRLARDFALSVCDKEKAPATIEVGENKVYETSRGAKLELPVKVNRREYKDALKLVGAGLPTEFKVKEVNVAAGEGKLEIDLTAPAIKAGSYTFYLAAGSKMKYARNPDALKRAEEEKKQYDDMAKVAADKQKAATDAKAAAVKAATDADAALKKAQQEKKDAEDKLKAAADADKAAAQEKLTAAEKALAEADKKAQETAAASKTAEEAEKQATDMAKMVEDLRKAAEKMVTDLKQATQPKDVSFRLASTPIRIRIAETPLKVNVPETAGPVKQGEKGNVAVAVERLYGFDDSIEVTAEPVPGGANITGEKLTLEKGKGNGELVLSVAGDVPPGMHSALVRIRVKWNNLTLEEKRTIQVNVQPK